MLSAGMMGAYTYNLRGGVFCNAQTANIVLMSMAFGKGQFREGLYYLIPITAYLGGAFVSEILPNPIKKLGLLRWDTCLVGFEIIALFLIGWIPFSVSDRIVQVMINFICSMQYNTFRQAEDVPMATTFCTNHVRQIGISAAKYVKHRDTSALKRGCSHLLMIAAFFIGGAVLTALCSVFQEKTIWLAILPLLADFLLLSHADLFQEHNMLALKPQGH
ncbi:MAG: DUF1275 domain-containing protein [Oscillospiraceae bacterium]|nr:DUF1275 domain-containing protein [Oscillospiraceae bacterium]